MTIQTFLARCRKINGWKLRRDGGIRYKDGRCPVEKIADVPSGEYERGIRLFGWGTSMRIPMASDAVDEHDPKLRYALLRACGLQKNHRQVKKRG